MSTVADQTLSDLLEAMPDAILLVDPDGRIVRANSLAESVFGYRPEELVGQPVEVLLSEGHRPIHVAQRNEFFARACTRAMGAHLNLLGWRKCGEEFPVEIRLSPLQTDSGKLVISAIRDVTERNLVEQSLERAMRLKSHFLANMSHELRTPLNGIIGFSELLVDGKVGPLAAQQATFLGDILSSGRHLLHLVNDLLDLSKIEAGRADLHAESFSVQACIDQVCSALSASSAEKRLCVTTEVSPALDVVYLDRGKLGQILMNLASNAVKFTEPGGEVHICATCGASAELQLQVSDTGVGMGPKELDRLFVEYHRMESDATCRLQGSGLGLTLTRRLVGLLNGSIGVRSEPGRGTTFTVILPYCAPPT